MTSPLQALVDYYDRLERDPEQDVAPFGFAREKISFCIVLKPDGAPYRIEDVRETVEVGGKTKRTQLIPRKMIVPDRGARSGTLIKPNFLWDNTGYVLGRDGKGKPARSQQAFEAFRDFHQEFNTRVKDLGLAALCAFLKSWDPKSAENRVKELGDLEWEDVCDANVVFKLVGQEAYVHDSPALRKAWLATAEQEIESQPGFCLISGIESRLARLHPMIRGVAGAQSSGAALVSFNLDAFESYRKEQSYNAPVGVDPTFRYTTALNRLVSDRAHYERIAGDTIVFWTDRQTAFEDDFSMFLSETPAEDQETLDHVREFWRSLKRAAAGDTLEDADVMFYALGLSPNASRLSVRFWLAGTVKEFAQRLGRHVEDLEMGYAPPDAPPLTLQRILDQTARERKDVYPLLGGAVLRAVLSGGPYPQMLCQSVMRRIRAEGLVNHPRASILKAYLIRKSRSSDEQKKGESLVSLNKEHPRMAYHLGRLFAVLEKTQEEAFDNKLNSTIKDRFFSSASANPVAAFPRLMRLHQHHLNKLDNTGRRINLEKLVQEIYEGIDGFPGHLPIDDQGLFFIGYYHQRQDLFTKKNDGNADNGAKEINA